MLSVVLGKFQLTILKVRYLGSLGTGTADQDALEVAKANLSKFDFIGLYESFPQSAARLCDYLGASTPPELPYENETSERLNIGEISPATIEMIKRINKADLALYDYARILVGEQTKAHALATDASRR